jgi:hypothetical protein
MRLIDADALIKQQHEILGCDPMYYQGLEASKSQYLIEFLERAQTVDAVPVVRCRECKSHGTLKSGELFCGKIKTGIYGYYHTVKADDYCSYGAKMEDKL